MALVRDREAPAKILKGIDVMKRTLLGLLAATALTAAIPAVASAQNINQRQDNLYARIEAGVRSGQLTRSEADRLRFDFQALARLENDYRRSAPGLTDRERADLNQRFNVLSNRIQVSRNDDDRYVANWQGIDRRQDRLFRQIDTGVRNGGLTRQEATRLRADFNALVRLEANYRRSGGGLTIVERRDLDRRMDALSARIRMERRDDQQAYRGDRHDRDDRRRDDGYNNYR